MYRFKLQSLLSHRRHQEEVCQKELADAQRNLSTAQEHFRRLKKDKRDNVQKLQFRQKERHSTPNILIYTKYIEQLSRDIETQREQVSIASQDVRHKRDDLIDVVKKRKTLEKLKEKERLAYQQKMMQAERKFNDEVAATRHIRNS
ncbi:MAG: flagellar export protein FliJ [Deltaproteobacteria bacterium]|nr:flagellar export protein FliJ [Deltaproteobacteria bacterium]